MCDAEEIASAGDDDEEIVSEDDEPGRDAAGEARAASSLHDVKRGRNQDIPAKCEDHRRSVKWTQAAESNPRQVKIEERKRKLARDVEPDREPGNAPAHCRDARELDRPHVVVGLAIDCQRRRFDRTLVIAVDDGEHSRDAGSSKQIGVERKFRRIGFGCDDDRQQCQCREGERRAPLTDRHCFSGSERVRHAFHVHIGLAEAFRGLGKFIPWRPALALMQVKSLISRRATSRASPTGAGHWC